MFKIFGIFLLIGAFILGITVVNAQRNSCDEIPARTLLTKPDNKKAAEKSTSLKNKNLEIIATKSVKKKNQLAAARKVDLVEIIRNNPDLAWEHILTSVDQKNLQLTIKNCLEQEVEVEGTLEIIHADMNDGTSLEGYYLLLDNGKRLELHSSSKGGPGLVSGTRVKVKGILLDSDLLLDTSEGEGGFTIVSRPSSLNIFDKITSPGSFGVQNTLVLMVNYQNSPQPNFDQAYFQDLVFNKGNAYYTENSYNKVSLTGTVMGWTTIPIDQTCNYGITRTKAIEAVDPQVDFTQYSRLVIYAPFKNADGSYCGWLGWATIGKVNVYTADGVVGMSIAWMGTDFIKDNEFLTMHELGHNFGVHHATYQLCGDVSVARSGCTYDEYGDKYNVMGSGVVTPLPNGPAHMNALHKEYIGWFNTGNLTKVTTVNGTFNLKPIESSSSSTLALKIPRGKKDTADSTSPANFISDYLYLEYRQPIGMDSILSSYTDSNIFQGAIGSTVLFKNKSGLIDLSGPTFEANSAALGVGQSFTDTNTGTTVTTTNRTDDQLTLNVKYKAPDKIVPAVAITDPINGASASGTISVKATASDNNAIWKVQFYLDNVLRIVDSTPDYEWSWNTLYTTNGNHTLKARTYDLDGNKATSAIVNVTVQN